MNDIERLKKAILDLHGCRSFHIETVRVHEMFEGKPVSDGDVEVFALANHLQADIAYAWTYKNDAGETRHVAVLGVPPINSAVDAVRAYIVAGSQKHKKK